MIKLNKEQEEWIKVNYPVIGLLKSAEQIGINSRTLSKIIKELRIKKNRNVEISNFDIISKKEVAYFLGFFWSDGYLIKDKITIEIKYEDGREIFNILNKFGKWNIYFRNRILKSKEYKQCNILINDKFIKIFLLQNGYGDKSLNTPTEILSKIPDNLKSYFFRGLIDGDGCFCSKNRNYFSITGNINQDWTEIENLLIFLGIKYTLTKKERKTGNSSYVVISNKKDIIKLGNYIYGKNFDNIGLSRKYKIYEEIKNKPISKYSSLKYN